MPRGFGKGTGGGRRHYTSGSMLKKVQLRLRDIDGEIYQHGREMLDGIYDGIGKLKKYYASLVNNDIFLMIDFRIIFLG